MTLDPNNVPPALRGLLPFAAKWGVGDDYERDCLVEAASPTDRVALLHCIDDYESELFDWLAGPGASLPSPSEEYVALTNLTLAIDYAKALGT